ncbi:MAG TPA: ABC transporter permease [Mycobacteriales bacterium]|nr:ABC transporter permease [Mycobacteriales bacterium]
MSLLADLRGSRELLVNLTLREVRGKYKRTALGQGWSLLNPLVQMAIFTVVFGVLIKIKPDPGDPSGLQVFALWLVAGLLPWAFFSNAVTGGMGALIGNANLINKVYFPRETLVLSTVFSWNVSFAIELAVLTVVLLLFGGSPLLFLPLVVVAVLLLTAFSLGIALALSVANVYFRDTQHFMALFMQVWFYATPIVYPFSYVQRNASPTVETLYRLNPMERFVTVFRTLLYDNRLPALGDSVSIVVAAGLALVVGWWLFRRYEGRLAEEL